MKKQVLILLVVVFVCVLGFLLWKSNIITGSVVSENNYTWTRAICNSQNECIDVIVYCQNGEVVRMEPISNLKKFSDNWTDPRNKDVFCE